MRPKTAAMLPVCEQSCEPAAVVTVAEASRDCSEEMLTMPAQKTVHSAMAAAAFTGK